MCNFKRMLIISSWGSSDAVIKHVSVSNPNKRYFDRFWLIDNPWLAQSLALRSHVLLRWLARQAVQPPCIASGFPPRCVS